MARPKRREADWFHHRVTEPTTERKLAHLQLTYGGDGYMFYYKLLEYLTKQPRYRLKFDDLAKSHLILHVGLEKNVFENILKIAIEIDAFQMQDDVLSCDWLTNDLRPLEVKRKQQQERDKSKRVSVAETPQKKAETMQEAAETVQETAETHIVEERREEKRRAEKSRVEETALAPEELEDHPRSNLVLETLVVFDDLVQIFSQEALEFTDERRKNLDAALRWTKPDRILAAAKNLVCTDAFKHQDDRHFDYLLDHFKFKERISFWENGGPPRNGTTKNKRLMPNARPAKTELKAL